MLKIAWSPYYAHPLPEGHRFPMEKYNLIPEQLLYEGTINQENLFEPGVLTDDEVLLTHERGYWQKLKSGGLSPKEIRKTGFPFSERLIHREINIGMGTLMCAGYAFEHGIAMNTSGGTHHAFTDRGEGFCLLNDIAMAANILLARKEAQKILVVDLDVHQGNGTAEIFKDSPEVFTFSMHCRTNYPMEKEVSDLDISLEPFMEDEAYLKILQETLPGLIEQESPDFIFYLSGVDILATDKLGKLSMTRAGCRQRDLFVFQTIQKRGIPVVASMGGGYSPKIADIVEAHCNTYRVAQEIYF